MAAIEHQPAAPLAPVRQALDAERSCTVAWAAGLFEGEGTFGLHKGKRVPTLSIAMTDLDVLKRFQTIVGCGKLYVKKNGGGKRCWSVDIVRADDIFRVIGLIRPYLGERRGARADELTAALHARIDEATAERECPQCHRRFRPRFASNATRQRFCRRQCTSNWFAARTRAKKRRA